MGNYILDDKLEKTSSSKYHMQSRIYNKRGDLELSLLYIPRFVHEREKTIAGQCIQRTILAHPTVDSLADKKVLGFSCNTITDTSNYYGSYSNIFLHVKREFSDLNKRLHKAYKYWFFFSPLTEQELQLLTTDIMTGLSGLNIEKFCIDLTCINLFTTNPHTLRQKIIDILNKVSALKDKINLKDLYLIIPSTSFNRKFMGDIYMDYDLNITVILTASNDTLHSIKCFSITDDNNECNLHIFENRSNHKFSCNLYLFNMYDNHKLSLMYKSTDFKTYNMVYLPTLCSRRNSSIDMLSYMTIMSIIGGD